MAVAALALSIAAPTAWALTPLGDYFDPFPAKAFNGSAGSIAWNNPWVEGGDDDDDNAGAVQVDNEGHCADNFCLVLGKGADDDGSAWADRSADLTAADAATLSFNYKRHRHGDGNGQVQLQVSATGTGGWTTLRTYALSATDSGQTLDEHNVTPWISATTTIRFLVSGNEDDSHMNVDDVRIELFENPNGPPALDPIADATIPEHSAFTFTATASDPDVGDDLFFSLDGAVPAGAAITADGDFSWTPSEAQGPGVFTFSVLVTDSGGASDSQAVTITVTESNAPPVLSVIGDRAVAEGSLLTFTATAVDPDTPSTGLAFSLSGSPPSGAAMTSAGVFTWTPSEAQGPGSYAITITVADDGIPDGVRTDSETITVTVSEVNLAPSLAAIADTSVDEGTTLAFTATATDPDLPANDLDYTLVGAPPGATMTAGGSYEWTPTESQGPGIYTFDVVVADNGTPPKVDTESVTVTVAEANIAPIIDAIGTKYVNEGSLLTFAVTATDTDSPPDSVFFSLFGAPAGASITPGGTFSWTPAETQGPGTYTFDVVATDDGSPPMARSQAVTIVVSELNAAPVLAAIPPYTITEGTDFTFIAVATDIDRPDNTLAFSLEDAPAGATMSASGRFEWIPSESQGPGTYSFDVIVTDDGSPARSDSQTVTIHVTDGNNAPIIDPIPTVTGAEESLIVFRASAVDPDVPADTFWFSLTGSIPAGASMTSGGLFMWTPAESHGPGTYTITVKVTDRGSPARSSTLPVKLVVTEANQPPRLDMLDDYSVEAGLPYLLAASASDPDLPAQTLRYNASGLPDGAELSPSGELTWHPAGDMVGNRYTVTMTVTDSGSPALSDTGAFALTVISPNLPPVLSPIPDQAVQLGEALSLTAEATDDDGPADELRFSLGPDAPAGATIDPITGEFEWRPRAAQNDARHEVTVTVTDGGALPKSDSATFRILVGRENVPPLLNSPGEQTSMPGERPTVVVPGADPDAYPSALVYSASNLPPGLAVDTATGAISGTVGFSGLEGSPFAVEVTVSDGHSTTSIEFSWNVVGVTDPQEVTAGRHAIVGGIVDITSPPAPPPPEQNDVVRSLVIMSRALRTGVSDMSLPLVLLVLVIGGLIALGRIGIVPVMRRGTRYEGTIRRYDLQAGAGLVVRATDGAEVFVHYSAIKRRDRKTLMPGDSVVFRTIDGAYRDLVTRLRRRQ